MSSRPRKARADVIRAIPLGGLGEIGAMNMMVYEHAGALLVVDCGLMFPESDMPGIDLVIPDVEFLVRREKDIRAIVLTHGHEDHLGALPYVLRQINPPVYAAPMTAAILRSKLQEADLDEEPDIRVFKVGDLLDLDPFKVDTIHVTHSIPDAASLAIETAAGIVIHTADFKFDPTPVDGRPSDLAKLAAYGKRGVLALLSDSTNSERRGHTPSERSIRKNILQAIQDAPGRVVLSGFSSNIHRNQQIMDCVQQAGRKLCILGRSMETNFRIARELGYIRPPEGLLVALDELQYLPDREVALLTTGSQGEPMSVLTRMAMGSFRGFQIQEGDTIVLSAKFIPGNERSISNMMNAVLRKGATIVHHKLADIHVSGHASQEEQKLMIELTRPRFFVPVHGEVRQMTVHRDLAVECGVPRENTRIIEDGQTLEFGEDGMRAGEPVPAGRVFVDGKGVGDVGPAILRDRMHLSSDGMVICVLVVNRQTGDLAGGPDLFTRGVMLEEKGVALLDRAKKAALEAYEALEPEEKADFAEVETEVRRALKKVFDQALDRRPMIIPIAMEM